MENVPEFVCSDSERYEQLIELFEKMPIISKTTICFKRCKKYPYTVSPVTVSEDFFGKGLYYYDSEDNSKSEQNIATLQKYYTLQSKPVSPLKYYDLLIEIQELLKSNFLPIDDFGKLTVIEIEDAYYKK